MRSASSQMIIFNIKSLIFIFQKIRLVSSSKKYENVGLGVKKNITSKLYCIAQQNQRSKGAAICSIFIIFITTSYTHVLAY